jgi:hypothetical protein
MRTSSSGEPRLEILIARRLFAGMVTALSVEQLASPCNNTHDVLTPESIIRLTVAVLSGRAVGIAVRRAVVIA